VCIAVYDMKIIETLVIENCFQACVSLRLIVFKPFIGEVLTGKIAESTSEGIEVDLVFVSAFIPAGFLNEPSSFDELENAFVWHYDENELFYDKGETVRFKVNAFLLPDSEDQQLEVLGRVNEDGLGLVKWWTY
jgi:DNA-directed RNA polymerase III subunit RPC8